MDIKYPNLQPEFMNPHSSLNNDIQIMGHNHRKVNRYSHHRHIKGSCTHKAGAAQFVLHVQVNLALPPKTQAQHQSFIA